METGRERDVNREERGRGMRKWHPDMKSRGRMTNRTVLAEERGRYIVKRGNGGPGVYKEKQEENGGIRFRNKQAKEGQERWRNGGLRSDK